MGAREHRRADHAPYIAAVRCGIEARDIRVTGVTVTTSADDRREAAFTLRPDEAAFAGRIPREASASWDEDNGWSLTAGDERLSAAVHKGLGVLPDPEDVAAWAVVLLAHPELTPSREDRLTGDHPVADPGFEARLARYASSGA